MMQRFVLALAGASFAVAAPAVAPGPITGANTAGVTDTAMGAVGNATPAVDLPTLLSGLLSGMGGMKFKTADMTQEEAQAMEQIERTISEVIQELEAMQGSKMQSRSVDAVNVISDLLARLNLGDLLGKVNIQDMTPQESELMNEASDMVMQLAKELQGQAMRTENNEAKVEARQLDLITGLLGGLPIVGPLLQSLLGGLLGGVLGGGGGGVGGTVGGLTGTVGGLTGGLTGTVGGLTGGLTGGLPGTGGLTGTVGSLTGGVAPVGGLTGTVGGLTGGGLGGLTGTVGGLTGGLGGLTGGLGGLTGGLGGLTGGLGGLTGGLGGLTGGLGGLTGGLLPGGPPGTQNGVTASFTSGLLGKITDEQMATARKAEEMFNELETMLEKNHAQQ